MKKTLPAALAALVLAAAAGTTVYAAKSSGHDNDAVADLAKARITIVQAIVAAEQSASGQATRAELEHERSGLIYKVEVADAGANKVTDVEVDGITGKVLKAMPDRGDQGKDEADDD
ncbi:MAG: PepSY domain-containing protein [Burkholderiales bacterium]